MLFLFILQYLPFSFFVVLKRQGQVLINLRLRHTKAAACTRDIISNAHPITTITDAMIFGCTFITL